MHQISPALQDRSFIHPAGLRNERTAGYMPVLGSTDRLKLQSDDAEVFSFQSSVLSESKISASETDFGFADLLDTVNPLQHIPVLGHFYRMLSGDEIKVPGRVIGGALFGGPLGAAGGLISAVADGVIEEKARSGRSVFSASLFDDSNRSSSEKVAVAYESVAAAAGRTAGTIPVYSLSI